MSAGRIPAPARSGCLVLPRLNRTTAPAESDSHESSVTKLVRPMPAARDEHGAVVLEAAASLFANGAATDDVVDLIHQADQHLPTRGGKLTVLPQWGELHIVRHAPSGDVQLVVLFSTPAGMSVNRVMATTAAVVRAMDRAPELESVQADMRRATALPPLPLPVFAVGAAAGACALAAIFGEHGLAFFFVALAGAVGAVARRGLLRIGGGLLTQDACAASLPGSSPYWPGAAEQSSTSASSPRRHA